MGELAFFLIALAALFASGFNFLSFGNWKHPRMKFLISPIYKLNNMLNLAFSNKEIMPSVAESMSMIDRLQVFILEKTGASNYQPLEKYARIAYTLTAIVSFALGLSVLAKNFFEG